MGRQKGLGLVGDGVERKAIKEVDAAAEAYVEQRDKRMKLSEKEKAAKDALIEVMAKHKLTVYRDDDADPPLVVTLSNKAGVKVESVGEEQEEGAEAEGLN